MEHPVYEEYFEVVKESLLKKRQKPKDDRIRELHQDHYHIQQDNGGSVSTFAHRLHELEKCIPSIHYTATHNDIELRYAFLNRPRTEIGKALMSQDAKCIIFNLAEIIEAAKRLEQSFPSLPVLTSDYVNSFREDKSMLSNKRRYICNQPSHVKNSYPLQTVLEKKGNKPKLPSTT